MIVPLEKPGTPEELVHFGVKGMKWGVRNKVVGSSGYKGLSKATQKNVARTRGSQRVAQKTARTIQRNKKKIAIGVGTGMLVAGTVTAAYILHKNGKLPVNPLSNRHPHDVQRILDNHGKVSRREWKRLVRMRTADREAAVRMKSHIMNYEREMARQTKAAHDMIDKMGLSGPDATKAKEWSDALLKNVGK